MPDTMLFKDYYLQNRNNIILAYDHAKETALKAYDDIAIKLQVQFEEKEKLKKPNVSDELSNTAPN
jgi:hypothetical protein